MVDNSDDLKVGSKYFDLDDIIASSSSITCTVNDTIRKDIFPLLNLKCPDTIDPKGVRLDVPLFLVPAIKHACEINLPKAYTDAVQAILASNASHVNLRQMQQHFYLVGVYLADLIDRDDGKKLTECLLETFVQRIGDILSKALHGDKKSEKVDNLESAIFEEVIVMRRELLQYMKGSNTSNKRKHV